MKKRTIRTIRNAAARGRKVTVSRVPAEALEHRKGTAAATASRVFAKLWTGYVKGDVKRKVLVEKAAKQADISPATASTYLHNFAQTALQ